MRFALLGDHPDGLAFARALVRTGRHSVAALTSPPGGEDRSWAASARLVRDLADVIADPALEAVIVAGPIGSRETPLRRALQSERHVLCVHPSAMTPDTAYEAALIRQDTGVVLLPLLSLAMHPGVRRLAELLKLSADQGGIGTLKLIEMEVASQGPVMIRDDTAAKRASLPGWEVLRRLGGEIAEVTAFTERPELSADVPLFVSGVFAGGGQFQLSLRPHQSEERGRVALTAERGSAVLTWSGTAKLTWPGGERTWQEADVWTPIIEVFEKYVTRSAKEREGTGSPLSWQDEVRALELDDAVFRSVEKRRSVPLEYPEATEEAGFKGTMTLLGCGLLWALVVLLILAVWVPWLGWLVLPVLVIFLVMQSLLWVARKPGRRGPV